MKTPWQYAETGNEFSHQVALFQWCAVARMWGKEAANDIKSYTDAGHAATWYGKYPDDFKPISELQWLHAIKNAGHGDAIRGARSAMEGVKAGVPDIFLPVVQDNGPGKGYDFKAGLYIELKRPTKDYAAKGVVSKVQLEWQSYLMSSSYAVEVCYGWESARDAILKYLGR